jgi:hypothetical protein
MAARRFTGSKFGGEGDKRKIRTAARATKPTRIQETTIGASKLTKQEVWAVKMDFQRNEAVK